MDVWVLLNLVKNIAILFISKNTKIKYNTKEISLNFTLDTLNIIILNINIAPNTRVS